jgi:hypothetical protein
MWTSRDVWDWAGQWREIRLERNHRLIRNVNISRASPISERPLFHEYKDSESAHSKTSIPEGAAFSIGHLGEKND